MQTEEGRGVCRAPALQKNPAVGLCQANCAATHLVCNPGIREVRGKSFHSLQQALEQSLVPTLRCQRDYLSDGLLVCFSQEA